MLKRIVLLAIIAYSATVGATAQTSAFTYQGKLTDAGLPANGSYDLTFRLYNGQSSGSQIGADQLKDDVNIQHTGNGSFPQIRWTDSGDIFRGSIGVDTGGTGSMNFHVNGSDRLILDANGVVRTPGGIFIANPSTLVITSPNGACWGITVSNTGALSAFSTACP